MDDKTSLKGRGYVTWPVLNFGAASISQEWLKLELSNFVHREIISSLAKRITKHPWKGRGLAHVTHFACTTVGLEKFCHGTPLTDTNDAVDDGLVFVASWTFINPWMLKRYCIRKLLTSDSLKFTNARFHQHWMNLRLAVQLQSLAGYLVNNL